MTDLSEESFSEMLGRVKTLKESEVLSLQPTMTKDQMVLEALLKLVVELHGSCTDYQVTQQTLEYADAVLKANGWEVYLDEFTRAHIRKIDDKATN